MRDILALGFDPAQLPSVSFLRRASRSRTDLELQYDHIEFPGAVPRSFIGPILLSGATWPLLALGKAAGLWRSGLAVQMLGE